MLDYIRMRVLIGTFLLSFITGHSMAKEISLTNKNIRFFNSDIEFSKLLVDVYENYEFSKFTEKDFKKYSFKFAKNLRALDFKQGLTLVKDINH